ncbi:MAG: AraC family transcriptional regulator [Lachnospiraceae bacterium]|nr:AraC family transcriptional regulator [Lachnospiraceae bacterium]
MSPSFPKCNQAGIEFVISTNEELQEEVMFLSDDFPIAMYTQSYNDDASDYIPLHWHDELQITWVSQGELEYSINGDTFKLGADKLLLVKNHQLHSSKTIGQDTRTLCINFTPDIFHPLILKNYILPLLQRDAFSYSLLLLSPYQLSPLKKLLNWKNEPLGYFSVSNFLSHIFEQILNEFEEGEDAGNYEEIRLFQTMLSYIHNNYPDPLNVRQIADRAVISKNLCTALFRKYTGLSPIKYLNEYRLYTAKNLITHTDRTISEISADVGYNQISHFIEQFRNSYGLSPLKYRNKFGQGR